MKILRVTTVPISLNVLLKNQFSFMKENGAEVITASADGPEVASIIEREGVKHFVIPFTRVISPWQDLVCLWKMIKLIKSEKPNIIHSHTPKAGLIAMLAGKFCGVKHRLHTVAGMPLMEASGIAKHILTITEFLTYRSATHIYPNSKKLEQWIKANFKSVNRKLKVIGKGSSNGIDTNHFNKSEELKLQSAEFRKTNVIPDVATVFCFVGRLVRDKGVEELVTAFCKLTSLDAFLLLLGDYEDQREPLSAKVKAEIQTNNKILALGFQEDIRLFLATSDIFVFPSYREGFPNALLQACAMGLPCIATNINGNNEIIMPNENGLLIDVKNVDQLFQAMEELLKNNELRGKMAAKARNSILAYEQEMIWKLLLKEYKSLN